MWKLKGTEVVWEEEKKPKVADKPHWVTVLLGSFSSLVACAAFAVSLFSFAFSSRTALSVNRGYIVLSQGQCMASHDTVLEESTSVIKDLEKEVLVNCRFVLFNAGSMSLELSDVKVNSVINQGGGVRWARHHTKVPTGTLEPKSSRSVYAMFSASLRPSQDISQSIAVEVEAWYTDNSGQEHVAHGSFEVNGPIARH